MEIDRRYVDSASVLLIAITKIRQSVRDIYTVIVIAQLTTACLMIIACTHVVISGFDFSAETTEQFSSVNSCVVLVDDILRETNIFFGPVRM